MRLLYEAANGVEAHMILNLLEQQELSGRIDGAFLQGGIGELPAGNQVRVMVEEHDYAAAKAIVTAWDAAQPPAEVAAAPAPAVATSSKTMILLTGLAIGALCTFAFLRAPVADRGVDRNGDGVLDEHWRLSASGQVVGNEVDRNLDGKVDLIAHFNQQGLMETNESDDDFDGVFESKASYRLGEAYLAEVDTDGDAYLDLRFHYAFGVISTMEYINPASGLPRKTEYYVRNKMTHFDTDTDLDGKLDKRTRVDGLGEPAGEEHIR